MNNFGREDDPRTASQQAAAIDPALPTHDEWAKASGQMAAQTVASPLTRLRSSIRHRWASWVGERRHQLRAWLGLDTFEEETSNHAVTTFRWWTDITNGIRADLDATNAARADEDKNLIARVALTEANLAELVRQFHQTAQRLETHANTINGITKVPIVNKSVRSHLASLEIKQARAAARGALRGVPDGPAQEQEVEDALEQESADVIPSVMPEASEPAEHPWAD